MRTDSCPGRAALMVAHCAGMVDLVALPIWVGTLIGRYGFDPRSAGLLATLFLAGVVVASTTLAPRFHRLRPRAIAAGGYAVAAAGFWLISINHDFAPMAALHALAGVAAGSGLSVTHGTIARSGNPHRMFALVGAALGVFAVVFLGATPPLVEQQGGAILFAVIAAVMLTAALTSLAAFPAPDVQTAPAGTARAQQPLPRAVWFGIAGIACMSLVQSMTFSFLERVGNERGFSVAAITAVLVALGIVNLFPAPLAALLERKWPARRVMLIGPAIQAALTITIMNATGYGLYAAAASVFAAVMIFTHTFAFGALARMDRTGRSMAATPAMLMSGAAVGPILGGTLVMLFGYGALGAAAAVIGIAAVACFARMPAAATSSEIQQATA